MTRARHAAHWLVGQSYLVSKQLAQARMSRRTRSPIVVFSMGKTASTALARALSAATGERVFQVFRLDPVELAAAERRYRAAPRPARDGAPFPGALHLWESEYLLRHPPAPAAPWTVVTPVREPVAQAVSAFFHARAQRDSFDDSSRTGSLVADFEAGDWIRRPLRWFEREFAPALGIDVYAYPFDRGSGHDVIEAGAVRVLLIRQENSAAAPAALARFLGLGRPVAVVARNEAAAKDYAERYHAFRAAGGLPPALLDRAYGSPYARHFYTEAEIRRYREGWGDVS